MPSFSAKHARQTRQIAILVFHGTKLLDVCGPLQVFSDARLPDGTPAYQVDLLSQTGGMIATDTVCTISSTPFADRNDCPWDTVLISGGNKAYQAMQSEELLRFVDLASKSCRRLASICLGTFVLAAGGHLAGRRATTHWGGCGKLAAKFPEITVDDDAIFIEDRGIWTSAGVTAGIDMALAMVKDDLGAGEALRLAKSLVLPLHRGGGQRQYSGALQAQVASAETRFARLVADMQSNLQRNLSVSTMAGIMCMSERNFSRLFKEQLGTSPARFVEWLRVEHVAGLLSQDNITLAAARADAGFANEEQMRRAFHRCKGVSPSEFAAKFRSGKSSDTNGQERA